MTLKWQIAPRPQLSMRPNTAELLDRMCIYTVAWLLSASAETVDKLDSATLKLVWLQTGWSPAFRRSCISNA